MKAVSLLPIYVLAYAYALQQAQTWPMLTNGLYFCLSESSQDDVVMK